MERMVQTALNAGAPRDQVNQFAKCGYTPFPWQWEFHAGAREADNPNGPVDIGLGGARGPGKSHAVLSQVGLDDCQRVAGLKALFLRQTGVSAKESFEDVIDKALRGKVPFVFASNVLRFSNGSRILLGGFKDERDIDKYIGIEYDIIIVEELNQLTKERIDKLKGSLRTSKPNWRPRFYSSFNPGGKGHAWVRERYVIPYRNAMEDETRFYPSTYKSNVFLNKEYTDYLEGLTGDLGRAWREGEWDLFAGQYFAEWRHGIHVCDPYDIPDDWKRICALDYGYSAPASIGWYAIDYDGRLIRYKELYVTEHTGSQLAEAWVANTNPSEKIDYIVCDPSFWAKKGESDDALSTAEKFENRLRIVLKESERSAPPLIRGNNDRISGWSAFREFLRPFEGEDEKLTALLQVFSTCTEFIRTVPALIYKEGTEDCDTDGEDHCADECRYVIMSRPKPSKTREEVAKHEFNQMIKRKKQRESRSGGRLFT